MIADEGYGFIRNIEIALASYPGASLQDKTKLYNAIQENFGEVDKLKKSLHTRPAGTENEPRKTELLGLQTAMVSAMFASQGKAMVPWLLSSPKDNNIYFVGAGYDYQVSRAAEKSLEDAKRNCKAYLLVLFEPLRTPGDGSLYWELADFLVTSQSINEVDRRFEYLPGDSLYLHASLLEINRDLISNDIAFFADTKRPGIPVERITEAVMKARGLPESIYGAAYAEARESIRALKDSLSFGERKRFLYARELKAQGDLSKSLQQSSVLTAQKVSFVPFLHDQARTYELKQDNGRARASYEMALTQAKGTTEKKFRVNRDYGLFLYAQKSFSEAVSFLKKCMGQ